MSAFDIEGRTAIVTGGASGIGLALVRNLVGRGAARVVVAGRDPAKLDAVRWEFGPVITTIAADLAATGGVFRLADELAGLAPDASLLINNAGSQLLTDFTAGVPPHHVGALAGEIAVNLTAPIQLCAALLPRLAKQPSAAIVNVTSGLALAPKRSAPTYCATKAGLRSFSRALRYQCEEVMPHVRVIEALPPIVDTQMTAGRGRGKISAQSCADQIIAGLIRGLPEIYVGKSALLKWIIRASPALAYRIMRKG